MRVSLSTYSSLARDRSETNVHATKKAPANRKPLAPSETEVTNALAARALPRASRRWRTRGYRTRGRFALALATRFRGGGFQRQRTRVDRRGRRRARWGARSRPGRRG